MKRVDNIVSAEIPYSVDRYFSRNLRRAFLNIGVECNEIVIARGNLLDYIHSLDGNPPDWTCSFGPLTLSGQPFCDLTGLPHFCWQTKHLLQALHCLKSPNGFVGFFDRHHEKVFRKEKHDRFHFLPFGVDTALAQVPREEKTYDIVLFDDLKCTSELENTWKVLFTNEILEKMYVIRDFCLEDPLKTPIEAIFEASFEIDAVTPYLIYCLEEYLKAIRIRGLIESIEGRRVDVFGEHSGNNWLKRLKNGHNVHLHSSLPYPEHFEVLKRSKLLLRDQFHQDCSDEWAFGACLTGCMVISNPTPYLDEAFEGKMPFFAFTEVQSAIDDYLEFPKKREGLLEELKEQVLNQHSFEVRAAQLLKIMQPNEN